MVCGRYDCIGTIVRCDHKPAYKMQPTNPNAITFVKQVILKVLYLFPLLPYQCTGDCGMWNEVECKVWSVKTVEC